MDVSGAVMQVQEKLTLSVRAGMKKGSSFRFANKGNETIPGQPGPDLVFVIDEKPHATFNRSGNDLYHTVRITLDQVRVNLMF